MRGVRFAWIVGAAVLGSVAGAPVAEADRLLLNSGDHVVGELELADFPLLTNEGSVRVEAGEVWQVTLGTIAGDIVDLRSGGSLVGVVDQATYSIRLDSGQTVVIGRRDIGQVLPSPR